MAKKTWTFLDFLVDGRRNDIYDWMKNLPAAASARLDALISYLEVTEHWRRPEFDALHGKKYRGIAELRFKADKIQYRPLGCHGPERRQFTLLIGCEKKGPIYRPASARETAVARRQDLSANPTWVEVHRG